MRQRRLPQLVLAAVACAPCQTSPVCTKHTPCCTLSLACTPSGAAHKPHLLLLALCCLGLCLQLRQPLLLCNLGLEPLLDGPALGVEVPLDGVYQRLVHAARELHVGLLHKTAGGARNEGSHSEP